MTSPYFTLAEAAAYACCSKRTVQRWLATKQLTRYGTPGGSIVLILKSELEPLLSPAQPSDLPSNDPLPRPAHRVSGLVPDVRSCAFGKRFGRFGTSRCHPGLAGASKQTPTVSTV